MNEPGRLVSPSRQASSLLEGMRDGFCFSQWSSQPRLAWSMGGVGGRTGRFMVSANSVSNSFDGGGFSSDWGL